MTNGRAAGRSNRRVNSKARRAEGWVGCRRCEVGCCWKCDVSTFKFAVLPRLAISPSPPVTASPALSKQDSCLRKGSVVSGSFRRPKVDITHAHRSRLVHRFPRRGEAKRFLESDSRLISHRLEGLHVVFFVDPFDLYSTMHKPLKSYPNETQKRQVVDDVPMRIGSPGFGVL